MVGMKSKLKAATLFESLIAMIIIIVCFGVAVMIYTNVLNSDKQRSELTAILLLNKEAVEFKKEKKFIDDEKKVGDWNIKKTIQLYEYTKNVYHLQLMAIDKNGNTIATRNELITIE
jgi:Tfp pilus assembly protein PilE